MGGFRFDPGQGGKRGSNPSAAATAAAAVAARRKRAQQREREARLRVPDLRGSPGGIRGSPGWRRHRLLHLHALARKWGVVRGAALGRTLRWRRGWTRLDLQEMPQR